MSLSFMEKSRVPILKKIIGDDSIQCNIPIVDAQFLIGKSWDVSLKLNLSEVQERHCTIEKIAADAWTLVSHENAAVKINKHVSFPGISRLLKCGDFMSLSTNIVFQFICSSLNCDKCNKASSSGYAEIDSPLYSNAMKLNCGPGYASDPLLNHNAETMEHHRSFTPVPLRSTLWANDVHSSGSNSFEFHKKSIDSREKIFDPENLAKNCDWRVLADVVSLQTNCIEKLRMKMNRFHDDFKSAKNHSNYLEGINQHLNNENVTLRAKIAQYIENAEALRSENLDLQAEVVDLKTKQEKLMVTVENQLKEAAADSCNLDSSYMTLTEVNRNCAAVMEVKSKLTRLLETEFKCTICDEVFVEAIVTNCGHTFCEHCLSTWKVIKPNCPICRSELINETRALAVDSYLNNIMPFASNELRNNWLKVVEERKHIRSKSQRSTMKRKYVADPLVTINIEYAGYALHQFYERLFNNELDDSELPIVDLTSD